ncbi:helix-turn-helix domain-containing protein [Draconibacterium mangrovi]|uniref:helix-turn-helix domain-containing protein n=1 Tax=Draconibacterium mangrovi TaxID=2697469 RepID=UPI0013D0B02D|nr:helix-turn-helix domain-containing protein [Draconibacterium mangrovi]
MRIAEEINEFDFFIDTQAANTIKVEDKLLLVDNLDREFDFGISSEFKFKKGKLIQDIPIKTNFGMVLFCIAGEMRLQINLKEITVKKNCIFGIMPGSVGKLYYISNNFRSASIFFSNKSYQTALDIQYIIESQHLMFNNPITEISPERMTEFIDVFRTMYCKLSDENFKSKLDLADAYLQVLTVYWEDCKDQHAMNIPHSKPSRQKVIFDAFLNEIIQHYRVERSTAFYAEKLFISPKYLSKVIKDVSNRQPSDWIKELVILEAKALLRTQQYTVLQISEQLNFTSPSFFGRYFREAVGCTPRNYQLDA